MLVGNDVRSYMMALYSQGTCWVVYRTLTSYRGVGGWYLAQPETEYGVVAEPLVNWLQHNCPWLDT